MQSADTVKIEPKPSRLDPLSVASLILQGFDRHYALFRYGAQRAKSLFESGDWHGIQQLSKERIEYYDMRVGECLNRLEPLLQHQNQETQCLPHDHSNTVLSVEQTQFWQSVRQAFVGLLTDHRQP